MSSMRGLRNGGLGAGLLLLGVPLLVQCSSTDDATLPGVHDGPAEGAGGNVAAFSQPSLIQAHELGAELPSIGVMLSPRQGGWQREGLFFVSPTWVDPEPRFFDALSARAGERASDPLEVRAGKSARHALSLRLVGAASVQGQRDGGAIVYPDALPSADVMLASTESRVEQLILLRGADAPHELTWSVDLGEAIESVVRHSSGALLFEDAAGEPVIRIPAPLAIDAAGVTHSLMVEWDAGTLTLTVPTGQLTYPVLVDPAFEVAVWQDRSAAQPGGLRLYAMAYDSQRSRTVMFGGEAYETGVYVNKGGTWEWNGTAWSEACTTAPCNASRPEARRQSALAFDSQNNVAVLFGGRGGSELRDTWTWSGSQWTERCTSAACLANRPGQRVSHVMAYDSVRHVTVLFGGTTGSTSLQDTWEWDGSSWTPDLLTYPS